MQLEKVFNEFTKLVEVLAKDAGIFRDSIAGKVFENSIFALKPQQAFDSTVVQPGQHGTVLGRHLRRCIGNTGARGDGSETVCTNTGSSIAGCQ